MKGPEKPRHIDDRIRHLTTDDLLNAFARPAGVDDLGGLRCWLAGRLPRPAWPLPEWAAATRGTATAAAVIKDAAPLLGSIDVTGGEFGRSQRYGFHYLRWLSVGVSAWLLTDDSRYLEGFERHLLQWQARRDSVVGQWPGLDVIWYSLGTWARCRELLPTVEVLTDSPLSDRAWAALLATLVGGARWCFDEHDRFRHGNWQLVSASELVHLATVLPDLVEAPAWAGRGRRLLAEHLMLDVYPDGGHYERSPGYHAMCLEAFQTVAALDTRSTPYAAHPRLRAMHDWLVTLADPYGWVPHFQDSGLVWAGPHLLRGGYLLDAPDLIGRARAWMDPDAFAVQVAQLPDPPDRDRCTRWHQATAGEVSPLPARPAAEVLSESGYAVMRSGQQDRSLQVVINFGPHIEHELESHSHRAVLDFVVSHRGEPLLWEAGGPPSYDVDDYRDWFQSARGHNAVAVDDRDCAEDRDARCDYFLETPTLPFEPHARLAIFSGSHNGCGVRQRRMIMMVRNSPGSSVPGYVIISDDGEATGTHRFTARWQSVHPWLRVGDGLRFSSGEAVQNLLLAEFGDPAVTAVGFDAGVARRPHLDEYSSEFGPLHTLALSRTSGRFRTLLVPPGPQPEVAADGESIMIIDGNRLDRISVDQWSRTTSESWEAAAWRTDRLTVQNQDMITAEHCLRMAATAAEGRLVVVVECSNRSRLRIRGSWSDLRLGDVGISASSRDGWMTVGLPYAGLWTVTGLAP